MRGSPDTKITPSGLTKNECSYAARMPLAASTLFLMAATPTILPRLSLTARAA